MLKQFTKAESGWIMYDWANSAFSAIVASIVLPLFFSAIVPEGRESWIAYANSIATLICAVCAPFLGTLGDYRGYKKKLFSVFALIGIVSTALLGFTANWLVILILFIVSTLGFNGSCIFYDGFLPDVTTDERMDTVSTVGYGLGYIGGSTIPLLISVALIVAAPQIGMSQTLAFQLSFLLTAVWWLVFTIPLWRNVEQKGGIEPEKHLIRQTFRRLSVTLRRIVRHRGLTFFLLAYFFYIDGVGTIIKMASTFGEGMGLGMIELMVILLIVQVVAFPFAILYGKMAKKVGVRSMILCGIGTYLLVCVVALSLDPLSRMGGTPLMIGFGVLAFLVGTAQGGIQALSRSYYGKLVPQESANEFFGFFDIFGKFSAVIGPLLFGLVWDATEQVYLGIIPVACMFLIGLVLFLQVPKDMEKLHH